MRGCPKWRVHAPRLGSATKVCWYDCLLRSDGQGTRLCRRHRAYALFPCRLLAFPCLFLTPSRCTFCTTRKVYLLFKLAFALLKIGKAFRIGCTLPQPKLGKRVVDGPQVIF